MTSRQQNSKYYQISGNLVAGCLARAVGNGKTVVAVLSIPDGKQQVGIWRETYDYVKQSDGTVKCVNLDTPIIHPIMRTGFYGVNPAWKRRRKPCFYYGWYYPVAKGGKS